MILSLTINAQNCIKATNAAFINPSNDKISWFLVINWESDGQKHMKVTVNDGLTIYPTECFQSNSNGNSTGQQTYGPFITAGGNSTLGAKFERFTGTCNGGTSCGATQILHPGGGLPIKFGLIKAENIGQNTIITFQAESTDNENEVIINFMMKDGTKKFYKVILWDKLKLSDTWEITINNITNKYTFKKK